MHLWHGVFPCEGLWQWHRDILQLRLSVPPTAWVIADRSLGEICFTIRDCAMEQPICPCVPTEVPVGPSLPLSCYPVMWAAYKSWIALLPWRLQKPIASSFPMAMCPLQAHHCVYSLMCMVREIWGWWTMVVRAELDRGRAKQGLWVSGCSPGLPSGGVIASRWWVWFGQLVNWSS